MDFLRVGGARDLLDDVRAALSDLQDAVARLDVGEEATADLRNAQRDLEGLFLLVVLGEYNAGKSSLLNALLGEKVAPEGVTPTTDRITILAWGAEPREIESGPSVVRRTHPSPLLEQVALVDTPGTNAIITRHQELTERFVPRADLVLFVTSADRPFTESERAFLELIASWGKKITIVVNKLDILDEPAERDKVIEYVRDHARETLHSTPEVFGVMARKAAKARMAGDRDAVAETGLLELEAHIQDQLEDAERIRLKLLSPIGVGRRVADLAKGVVDGRLKLLAQDRRTLEEIERQMRQFEKDMRREGASYLARIKTILLEIERRGEVFFDDTVRLRNVVTLMNASKVRDEFERRVLRDADRQIDEAVSQMVDWFLERNLQLWEDVMGYLNERRQATEERIIGDVGGRFQYDRQKLLRNLRDQAEAVLATYDQEGEARRLADKLQQSVVQTGLLQVSGVGLGAAVLAFVSGAALDVTGVTLGLTLVGVGFLVLPRRRAQAKRELHEAMQELRDGLEDSLGDQLDVELQHARERLAAAIAPYTRFVRSELDRLDDLEQELASVSDRLAELRRSVGELELDEAEEPLPDGRA